MTNPTKLSEQEVRSTGNRHIKQYIEPIMAKAIAKLEALEFPPNWDEEDINSGKFANLICAAGEIFYRTGQNIKAEGLTEEHFINALGTAMETVIAMASKGYRDGK